MTRSPLAARLAPLLLLPLVASVGACGDDGSADANVDGSTSTDPSSGGSGVDTTQSSGNLETAGPADSTGPGPGTGSESTTGAPLDVTAEVVTYDSQPMVVDVLLTLSAPGDAVLSHTTDAGVVIAPLPGGDETQKNFRVRGLAPETTHTVAYEVTADAGGAVTADVASFDTPAALPAFIGAFVLETTDVDPAPLYRLSDWNPFPFGDFAGAMMVDPAGITRWYMSAESELAGPPAVWVGVKLRDDGTIMYMVDDTFFIRDELGTVLTEIPATDLGLGVLHHDVLELPSGNFLALSMRFEDVEYPDLGVTHIVGDVLVEFTPEGEVVWTWDSFDHLDPQRRRANFEEPIVDPLTGLTASDWTHANGFTYDPRADTVTLSMRHQDWIIQIDRATGEVLWRLGEDGDFTLEGDEFWFYHQHSPQWQPDGSLLLYDNANGNPYIPELDIRSRAVRYDLDFDAMTATLAWQDDEPGLQVIFAGDADRIEGGHILVTDSSIFGPTGLYTRVRELEVGHDPERIWSMNTPDDRWIYRTTAHPRLVGQPLE